MWQIWSLKAVYSAIFCVLPGDCRAASHGSFFCSFSAGDSDLRVFLSKSRWRKWFAFFLVQTSVKFSELGSFNTTKYVRSTVPNSYLAIGADTVLKLGAEIPAQSAGKIFLSCASTPPPQKKKNCVVPPILVAQRGHTTVEKIDIVKITRV